MEDELTLSLDGKTLGNLRVVDLKQELEKRGLSKSGSKKDLVKRLKQQLEFEKLCEERKSTGDCDLKLELDAATEQNEFVQRYLAQQQKIYAEQKEMKRLVELEEFQKKHEDEECPVTSKVENYSSDEEETEHEDEVSDNDTDVDKSNIVFSKKSENENTTDKSDEKDVESSKDKQVKDRRESTKSKSVEKVIECETDKPFVNENVQSLKYKSHEKVTKSEIGKAIVSETKESMKIKSEEKAIDMKIDKPILKESEQSTKYKTDERVIESEADKPIVSESKQSPKNKSNEKIIESEIFKPVKETKQSMKNKSDEKVIKSEIDKPIVSETKESMKFKSEEKDIDMKIDKAIVKEDEQSTKLKTDERVIESEIDKSIVRETKQKLKYKSGEKVVEREIDKPIVKETISMKNKSNVKVIKTEKDRSIVGESKQNTENKSYENIVKSNIDRTIVKEKEADDNKLLKNKEDITKTAENQVREESKEVEDLIETKTGVSFDVKNRSEVVSKKENKISVEENEAEENAKCIKNRESRSGKISRIETKRVCDTDDLKKIDLSEIPTPSDHNLAESPENMDNKDVKDTTKNLLLIQETVEVSLSSHHQVIQSISEKSANQTHKENTDAPAPKSTFDSTDTCLPLKEQVDIMEPSAPISSVPYSLSDIQLPESPGKMVKHLDPAIPEVEGETDGSQNITSDGEVQRNGINSDRKSKDRLTKNKLLSKSLKIKDTNSKIESKSEEKTVKDLEEHQSVSIKGTENITSDKESKHRSEQKRSLEDPDNSKSENKSKNSLAPDKELKISKHPHDQSQVEEDRPVSKEKCSSTTAEPVKKPEHLRNRSQDRQRHSSSEEKPSKLLETAKELNSHSSGNDSNSEDSNEEGSRLKKDKIQDSHSNRKGSKSEDVSKESSPLKKDNEKQRSPLKKDNEKHRSLLKKDNEKQHSPLKKDSEKQRSPSKRDNEKHRSPSKKDNEKQRKEPEKTGLHKRTRRRKSSSSSRSSSSGSSSSRNSIEKKSDKKAVHVKPKSLTADVEEKIYVSAPADKSSLGTPEKKIATASDPPRKKLRINRNNVVIPPPVDKPKSISPERSARISPEKCVEISPEQSFTKENESEPVCPIQEPSESEEHEMGEIIDNVPEVKYETRKLNFPGRKISRKSTEEMTCDEPKSKKSKWSRFASSQRSSQTINISTDSLKNWFPDFKLVNEPATPSDVMPEDSPPVKADKVLFPNVVENENVTKQPVTQSGALPKMEDEPSSTQLTETSGPVSKIIFIKNLVRPFTLLQLKELLRQNGNFIEEDFWIDKIKSKCFVTYETEEAAIKTKQALSGTRWPSSNPKILSAEFSTVEELKHFQSGGDLPKPVAVTRPEVQDMYEPKAAKTATDHKKRDLENRKERERNRPQAPMREWDKDKITQDSPERDDTGKHFPGFNITEKKEKKDVKKRPNEDTPAKLLDDLFQKTKSIPCVYWLPLTDAQVVEREEAKKVRHLEREKRIQQREKEEAENRNKRSRSDHKSRETENRRSSSRSRSPVSRRR